MDEVGLGERFLVIGHDRGGRVARRMAADHPEKLVGASLLDIMPMEWVYDQGSNGAARGYYHWYFFLQRGLAEQVLASHSQTFAQHHFSRTQIPLDAADVEHYITLFGRPQTIAATLGDYRTAFEVDRSRWKAELDSNRRIQVPLQLLWGDSGGLRGQPVLEEWGRRATSVRGRAITRSGHYVAEEQPEQVLQAISAFADELGLA
jgi:haloacetate dehalogenase